MKDFKLTSENSIALIILINRKHIFEEVFSALFVNCSHDIYCCAVVNTQNHGEAKNISQKIVFHAAVTIFLVEYSILY